MSLLPVNVHDQQHDRRIGLNTSCSNRVPALFSGFVYTIRTHQAAFVFEDQRRYLE
jgi:hypothetical protein